MNLKLWLKGIRPYSFPASISPIIVGLALAYNADYKITVLTALLTLMSALLMQIGANLSNDYYDHINEIDKKNRIGFERITGSGVISPNKIKLAFGLCFLVAFIIGTYLISVAGLPIALIGISSIVLAFLYTGGPFPLAYYGLGELIVIFYYGPIAVWGTYFIQTGRFHWAPALIGLGPGLISASIMAINNLRDRESDLEAGKRTLANILNIKWASLLPVLFSLAAASFPVALYFYNKNIVLPLTLPAFILFMPVWKKIVARKDLNISLKRTGQFLVLYSVLLSLGFFIRPFILGK